MNDPLDWMEVAMGAFVGMTRQLKHRFKGDKHRWGADFKGGWDRDIEGSCAELFAARETGLYWHVGVDGKSDVGGHQVRHTEYADGRMVVHEDDKDDDVVMLVTGRAPNFVLVGWALAHEGKKRDWWQDPQGKDRWAYFVPQSALHPMSDLPK